MIGAKSERLVGSKSRRDLHGQEFKRGRRSLVPSWYPSINSVLCLVHLEFRHNSLWYNSCMCEFVTASFFFFFDGKWNLNIFFFFLLFLRAKWRCFFWYFFNKESTNDNLEFLINKYPLTHDDDTKKIFRNLKFKDESAICRIVGTSLIN